MNENKIELSCVFEKKPLSLGYYFIYKAFVKEAISKLYEVKFLFVSKEFLPLNELSALLDTHVMLSIRQIAVGTKTIENRRTVKGMIVNYRFLGIVDSKDNKSTAFKYEITLAPDLIFSTRNSKIRSYASTDAKDLISGIVYDYGYELKKDLLSKTDFSNDLIFNQLNLSDYDFLKQLCCTHGFNFCFSHDNSTQENFLADMYLSLGYDVKLNKIKANKRIYYTCSLRSSSLPGEKTEILLYNFQISENAKNGSYSYYAKDSIDGINHGLIELYTANEFIRNKGYGPAIENRFLIEKNFNNAINASRVLITASCKDLNLYAGNFGILKNFAGESQFSFLVKESSLSVVIPIPADYGISRDDGEENLETLNCSFVAIPDKTESNPGFLIATSPSVIADIMRLNDGSQIIAGTVCDATGKISL